MHMLLRVKHAMLPRRYRDLKPENTLISESGHVLLADFGVSRQIREEATIHARTQVGTFMYMSPEQRFARPYSYEADYWAMACMLHEILTGELLLQRSEEVKIASTLPPLTIAFISELTCAQREDRLGFGPGGGAAVRAHPYFTGVSFEELLRSERGPLCSLRQLDRLTCNLSETTGISSNSSSAGAGDRPSRDAARDPLIRPAVSRRSRSPAMTTSSLSGKRKSD
jgi:serine/threonine protein kinase